jgi:hypothetical protein
MHSLHYSSGWSLQCVHAASQAYYCYPEKLKHWWTIGKESWEKENMMETETTMVVGSNGCRERAGQTGLSLHLNSQVLEEDSDSSKVHTSPLWPAWTLHLLEPGVPFFRIRKALQIGWWNKNSTATSMKVTFVAAFPTAVQSAMSGKAWSLPHETSHLVSQGEAPFQLRNLSHTWASMCLGFPTMGFCDLTQSNGYKSSFSVWKTVLKKFQLCDYCGDKRSYTE